MSRFAVVYEDPSYEEPEDVMDWLDEQIDGVKEEVEGVEVSYSPYDTLNS
jgi:hypothetical protein